MSPALPFPAVFLFAVFAAVNFFFRVCQEEDMIQSLLDRRDAAGIFAFDDVGELFRQMQHLFVYDLCVLDDIYGNVMIDEAEHIQVQHINRTFDLDNILFPHLIASRIFDDGHAAVHLIQLQIFVNGHAFSGLDMVENHAFV